MKKIAPVLFSVVGAIACAVGLVGCGGSTLEPYYGKTLKLTGAANAINWDVKCKKDDYVMSDETEYSYRELLTKHYDEIDFTYENGSFGAPWAGVKDKFSNAEELITYVDSNLGELFAEFKDFELKFGTADDMTVAIDAGDFKGTAPFVETKAQIQALQDKIEPHAYSFIESALNDGNPGKRCLVLLDFDEDEKYEAYMEVTMTAYVVNDSKPTVELKYCILSENSETDPPTYYMDTEMDMHEMSDALAFWDKGSSTGHSSILTLPFYPELTITANA